MVLCCAEFVPNDLVGGASGDGPVSRTSHPPPASTVALLRSPTPPPEGVAGRVRECPRRRRLIRMVPCRREVGQTLAMRWRWPWRRGPKRGVARGVAVFGPQGFVDDADALASLLGRRERLAAWLAAQGRSLEESPETLAVVDALLDGWAVDSEIGPWLGNEVGLSWAASSSELWPVPAGRYGLTVIRWSACGAGTSSTLWPLSNSGCVPTGPA
jgi:hypothetical protein